MKTFSFDELFIYDLANNHQGDLAHAQQIIGAVGSVSRAAKVRGALKFQFRQLDSFIHPDYRTRTDLKFIKRFSETRLSMDDFRSLAKSVKDAGLLTMCTPFDEESVDVIENMDLDIIKVASCSADDRPLLERVAQSRKPVVVSTAGLRIAEIDWLVNFLEAEKVDFALMHCVSIYPTPDELLQLNQISAMVNRYRSVPIGWSTHEDPNNVDAVKIALALGARLFERHVGIGNDRYTLNGYSSTPAQIETWLASHAKAKTMLGAPDRPPSSPEERRTLLELKRGVFLKQATTKGQVLTRDDVFFAMPVSDGQLISGSWREGLVADKDYPALAPLPGGLSLPTVSDDQLIYQIMLQVRGMLNQANVHINADASIEISHHYGLKRFREYGAVIITCINREYAKKLVVQLPRQQHPYHFHKRKEETFQLIDGDLEIVKNGFHLSLTPGDTFLVEPESWHKFHTLTGAIIEEISTTHYNNDSFYEDPAIARLERSKRKTNVDNWTNYFRRRHAL